MKKTEPTINNTDSQALLKQVALTESLGGWEDGILTIGTLGYDPLKSINPHKEYFALEIEVEQEDGEGENNIMVDDHQEEEKGYNAALVHMYDNLNDALKSTTRQLAGYITLLHVS